MSWSLGEIRALAIKAARGAGMSWGMAEEAGFACYWLEQHSLPGTEWLALLLAQHDANTIVTDIHATDYLNSYSSGSASQTSAQLGKLVGDRAICPLLLGTMISDGLLTESGDTKPAYTLAVSQAGLLLPFFYLKYQQAEQPVALQLTFELATPSANDEDSPLQLLMTIDPTAATTTRLLGERNLPPLSADNTSVGWRLESEDVISPLELDSGTDMSGLQLTTPGQRVSDSAQESVVKLQALAARTYAPMTDESRQKGAGAGTSDND